jgi:uncharacterized spore protein YtfJ
MKNIKEEVETKNHTYADDFVATLADKLGAVAKANIVFADPIERNGVTVIPVAKARWGFGGGSGRSEKEKGSGGGGGAVVTPIGFIEIRNGEAIFKRIHTLSPLVIAIGGLTSLLLMRGLFRRR